MKLKAYDQINVAYLGMEEKVSDLELEELKQQADYIQIQSDPRDVQRIEWLSNHQFLFSDRTILAEISLTKLNPNLKKNIRFEEQAEAKYTEEIYHIAREAFLYDRRFHLKREFDAKLASVILTGYIDEFRKKNYKLITCIYKEEILGFVIIKDLMNGTCENVLGAVKPAYQNKGAAISLYSFMANYLAEQGYKKLYGNISTVNIASLNLHVRLGAIFREVTDLYNC